MKRWKYYKIESFSLVELLIGLTISSIVIYFSFDFLTLLTKQFNQRKTSSITINDKLLIIRQSYVDLYQEKVISNQHTENDYLYQFLTIDDSLNSDTIFYSRPISEEEKLLWQ